MEETNCTQFYVCLSNKLTMLACPPGLKFDVYIKKCNYAYLVNCERNKYTTTQSSELTSKSTSIGKKIKLVKELDQK